MRKRHSLLVRMLTISVSLLMLSGVIYATERIIRLSRSGVSCDDNGVNCGAGAGHDVNVGNLQGFQVAGALENAINNNTFTVYTTAEIDGAFATRDSRIANIDQRVNELANSGGIIDQKIGTAETRIKDEVKQSIDKLPQRLLTEESKKVLKEAVLAELRGELAQLKQEMQKQIDDLKRRP